MRGFVGILPSASKPKTDLMRQWDQPAQPSRRAAMALEATADHHSSYVADITPEAPDCPDGLRRLREMATRSHASSVRERQLELVGAASGGAAMSHPGASTEEAVAFTSFRQGDDSRAAASGPVRSTDCSDGDREPFAGSGSGSGSSSAWDISGPGLRAEYSSLSLQASQVTSTHPSRSEDRMSLLE